MKNKGTIQAKRVKKLQVAAGQGERTGERRSRRQQSKPAPDGKHEGSGQSIWSGTISFSLVAIPVQLVKAVEPGRVSFRMLHRKDYSPLARRMLCPREKKIVPAEEIVRGYAIGPGQYIVVTDEELESVTPERSRTIEIIQFFDANDMDPICYDHPYYLVPSKGGEKAYALLVQVMQQTSKAGLARFVLGEREHLVAIRSTQGALSMITLHYSDEIVSDKEIAPHETEKKSTEESHLKKSIKEMAADFDPHKYANERRKKILKFLERKTKEKAVVEAPEVEVEGGEGPADLVAVLQESMRKVKKAR